MFSQYEKFLLISKLFSFIKEIYQVYTKNLLIKGFSQFLSRELIVSFATNFKK